MAEAIDVTSLASCVSGLPWLMHRPLSPASTFVPRDHVAESRHDASRNNTE